MKDTLIGNRYVLLEPVGSGGEARVFRARDNTTQNDVALRLPRQPGVYTPTHALPVFHPGWVQLLDWGSDPHHGSYQVYELLEGQTLDQIVRNSPFDPESWLDFVAQSLDAVGALHQAGLIHADLNAGNFLRTADRWKLLELPFLHFEPAGRSALFGSIYTLTPEQLDGTPPDPRSDLYALGCLYYYAASGQYPHAGANSQDIAINRLRFPAEPLDKIAPQLPAAWNAWVMTLLQREPQNRFPDTLAARQLLEAP
jgi:serine/threonine protein kinase